MYISPTYLLAQAAHKLYHISCTAAHTLYHTKRARIDIYISHIYVYLYISVTNKVQKYRVKEHLGFSIN